MTVALSPPPVSLKCTHSHINLQYLAFKYRYSLSFIMRAATWLTALLCASSAAASAAINAFKRVDRVLKPRIAAQHKAPAQKHEPLQKRASPYLNNITQRECKADASPRSDANWEPEFVVDGTKIPDVDVRWRQTRIILQADQRTV